MRILISDLSLDRIGQIERRMQAGRASTIGFLGKNDRLSTVVARDERACTKRKITPEQIADRLETLVGRATRRVMLQIAQHAWNDEITGLLNGKGQGVVLEGFRITGTQYRDFQECPYENNAGISCEAFLYACSDYAIENVETKRTIQFPGLLIHLARDHHFFEGSVSYRLEPSDAIETLGLERGVNYAPVYVNETRWRIVSSGAGVTTDGAREVIRLAPGIRIYRKGGRCILVAEREHVLTKELEVDGVLWGETTIKPGTYVYAVETEKYVV